jgi:DNA modification methylase
MKNLIFKKYEKLLTNKTEWDKLATFSGNKKLPVYNWFYYKEAFSKDLVCKMLNRFKVDGIVLDPFCGTGTTNLTCKEMGISSIGFDVLPISVFSAKVKTSDYNIDELKKYAKSLLKLKFFETREPKTPLIFKRAFDTETLKRIFFYRERINEIEDATIRNFFKLALINAVTDVSYIYKDGAVLKFRKRKTLPFRAAFGKFLKKMINDYKHFLKSESKSDVYIGFDDARSLPLKSNSVDAVITSPPYLGQKDYQRVYEIENFFVGSAQGKFIDSVSPEGYFKDLKLVFKELYRVCKNNSSLAVVVGNAYLGEIIDCDLVISHIANDIGFEIKNIFVLNKRYGLKNRTKKVGILRESLIELRKP